MVNEEGVKRCVRCGESKPYAAFAGKRSNLDGLQRHCRDCASEYHRTRQESLGRKVRPKVDVPEGHKLCLKCGEVKPWSEWHRNATASDGLSTRCKECRAAESRAGHLKRHYGMTEAERDELIASQGGVCCICLAAVPEHVDHCHKTGRVRGVLCFSCNAALGQFKDRPDAIRRAAAYVEGIAWKPTLVAPGVYQLPS
ncbi:endonuclease VII domain-containing protein [Streptomyces justiciae]|uniref:Endonuclease VII domain-containing protein n=1 Tax=Streptomyces justiciae TaxID=2780140 RepID=A0ABU3LXU3_9ACTN|nr:endonuclease VII domain-containing protein [Streptomyces justiciae]MDT7844070.1 endonuclease VII domain-containing protein [Streptomyces justiciae]